MQASLPWSAGLRASRRRARERPPRCSSLHSQKQTPIKSRIFSARELALHASESRTQVLCSFSFSYACGGYRGGHHVTTSPPRILSILLLYLVVILVLVCTLGNLADSSIAGELTGTCQCFCSHSDGINSSTNQNERCSSNIPVGTLCCARCPTLVGATRFEWCN